MKKVIRCLYTVAHDHISVKSKGSIYNELKTSLQKKRKNRTNHHPSDSKKNCNLIWDTNSLGTKTGLKLEKYAKAMKSSRYISLL